MRNPNGKRAKGLLINYAGYPYTMSSLMPDNGLANMAAVLVNKGHEVKILDYSNIDFLKVITPKIIRKRLHHIWEIMINKSGKNNLYSYLKILEFMILNLFQKTYKKKQEKAIVRDLIKEIKKMEYDFIGFKLWTGDGFSGSIYMAKQIRENINNIRIYGGGPQVDAFKEKIFSITKVFDALVYGEGEVVINSLAEYAIGEKKIDDIPNLLFVRNGKIVTTKCEMVKNLNELPLPAYDENIYPSMHGDKKIKYVVLDESRGCTNACAFCNHPIKSGGLIREKSPERVVDEIEFIINQFGINLIRFAGSNTPIKLMVKISQEILKRKLSVKFSLFGHIKFGSEEEYKIIKRAGGVAIFFGIESGSQLILDRMHKGISKVQIEEKISNVKKSGLKICGSIIFPAPFENKQSRQETMDLLKSINIDSVPVQLPIIIPGSKWANNSGKYNIYFKNYEKYVGKLMRLKVKHNYPPKFWQKLPYSVNNQSYDQIVKETGSFINELEMNNVLTQLGDEAFLMAEKLKMPIKNFRDITRQAFFEGDGEEIYNLTKMLNKY